MRNRSFIEYALPVFGYVAVIVLAAIVFTVFGEGIPLFHKYSVVKFLTGKVWRPTASLPKFGSVPLLVSTLIVSGIAMLFAVPLGVATALYIAKLASETTKDILKPLIELLASIPSVVYGFFGIVFVAPLVQKIFRLPVGQTGFTAGIILAFMSLPTIASISEDAITSVPSGLELASFGLGASKFETLIHIVIPAAMPGIITAISLGFGRAVGETMTVLMVAGGALGMPHSIFSPMRPITATIAAEMGETPVGSLHYHALFALAAELFVIVVLFNIVAEYYHKKFSARGN
ncbi:MAG: phosphate ABC transporter permease subunit PstC [Caldisericaceae bacterium]|nr:phosphate ABC transporter permease subunit PstC [Caldisericaceae bacterium]